MTRQSIALLFIIACRNVQPVADLSLATNHSSQAVWANGDFEADGLGTMPPTSWSLTTYLNNSVLGTASAPPASMAALSLGTAGAGVSESYTVGGAVGSQFDPDLGAGQSFRFPIFGVRAARVNYKDAGTNGKNKNVNMLQQTQTLSLADIDPADQQIHIRFAVAPVLEVPAHSYNQQPYYYVQLTNVTRGTQLYSAFNVAGQSGVPWKTTTSVSTGNTTQWLDWALVDIAPGAAAVGIGDSVQLTVIASGCSLGGHFGRIYVDGVSAVIPGVYVTANAPSSVNAGSTLTYTMAYANGGTVDAIGTHVDMTMPPNTTFASTSATGCTAPAGGSAGTLSCPVGTLAPGAYGSFTVTVNVSAQATGSIVNGNYAIGGINVPTLLGAKSTTTVNGSSSITADVVVTQTASVATANWGQTFTSGSPLYTIKIRNNSTTTQLKGTTGTYFTDTFPSTLTGVSWSCTVTNNGSASSGTATRCRDASGNANTNITGTGNISIKPRLGYNGGEVTYVIWGNVVSGSGAGTIVNTASIGTPGAGVVDPSPANNTTTTTVQIGTPGTLSLTKTGAAYGSISSSPVGLSCTAASSCASASAQFVVGAQVQLSASPVAGASFSGWGGACAGTSPTCVITMGASTSVSATFTAPPAPGPATNVYVYRGDHQLSNTSSAFATALSVLVTDASGTPRSGEVVTFAPVAVSGATASLSSLTATTSAAGIATVNATAGATAGPYTVSASIAAGASTSFSLTNVGPAANITYLSGGNVDDPQSTPTGAPFTGALIALVTDSAGQPVSGASVTFAAVAASGASASLSPSVVATDSNGFASTTATANGVVGAYNVDASIAGGASTSFRLQNVTTGPSAVFIVSGDRQSTATSSAFGLPLVVVVADALGNSLPNVAVGFALTGASGVLSASSVNTDSSGQASITVTAGSAGGTMTITASVAGVSPSGQFSLFIDGGQTIAVQGGDAQSATVTTAFGIRLQAVVTDANDAAVSGAVVTFAVPSTGPTATLSSMTATTNGQGIAAVTGFAGTRAGSYAVSATTPNALVGISFALTNLTGGVAQLLITSGSGQSAAVGDTFSPLVVTATDAYGNPVAGATVTFAVPATGATVSLSSPAVTDSSGVTSVTGVASGVAGSYSVSASVSGAPTVFFSMNNSCATDPQCAVGEFCDAGTCSAKRPNGGACTSANACISAACGNDNLCGLPNGEGSCSSAGVCRSGACGSDNLCGYRDQEGVCSPTGASVCRSGECSTSLACQPVGGCLVHADCPNTSFCSSLACVPDLANGVALPVSCSLGSGAAICQSGVCSSDDKCGFPNGEGDCTVTSNVCRSLSCGSDGACGYPAGEGVCNAGNASTVCRDAACSSHAFVCMPAGGCAVDSDCGASEWCRAFACVSKLPNGATMPTAAAHSPVLDGTCTSGAASAVCASAACDTDNKCGYPSGRGSCTANDASTCRSGLCSTTLVCRDGGACFADSDCAADVQFCDAGACVAKRANGSSCAASNACQSAICESGACGHANGVGPCGASNAISVCRSSTCSPNAAVCVPAGGCSVDADCATGEWCDAFVCRARLSNGTATPATCNQAMGERTCASGVCDSSDDACGYTDGHSGCAGKPNVCRSGVCSATDVCMAASACVTHADCSSTHFCDSATHACMAKLPNDTLLPSGTCVEPEVYCSSGVCDGEDQRCGHALTRDGCSSDAQCRTGVCSSSGVCVECTSASQCSGTTPICDPATFTCVQCANASDCVAGVSVCDAESKHCVATAQSSCNVDAECGDASYCGDDRSCASKVELGHICASDHECNTGSCGEGVCVEEAASPVLLAGGGGFGRGCQSTTSVALWPLLFVLGFLRRRQLER